MKKILCLLPVFSALFSFASPVPADVPELMRTFSGDEIKSRLDWERLRAPEILAKFESEVFGRRPGELSDASRVSFELLDAREAMDGKAIRKMVRCRYKGSAGDFSFPFTVFIPKSDSPVAAFVFICNRASENVDPDRVRKSEFWPAEEIVSRGYATATFLFSDVAADKAEAGFDQGIFSAVEKSSQRNDESWASISAWAWAASRVMDWIGTESLIDSGKVAVVGHSRGGKTSLWTAATDRRFAMACVNNSGCSGAKLNHIALPQSESIGQITGKFPHWFCRNYLRYAGNEMKMDFDSHQLAALVAPRLLAISSASKDHWAGQKGEWWCAKLASPAWELYGKTGLKADKMPEVGQAQQEGSVSYHFRQGKHDLTVHDWNRYMDFADRHGWNLRKPSIAGRSASAAATVDFAKDIGRMRPELHSSGYGPQICSCSKRTIDELKSMGFKASRTHDWSLLNPNQRVCDYFQMFPLMHLDATKPENYCFGPTDYLLKRTREELGHDVFFRLGTSIEHSGPDVHFNTQIPDDFDKVAEIFAGTIRHYNKGWGNGHYWDIKYWEIWNEPDNMNCMWCLPDGDGGKGATPEERMADLQRRETLRRELFVKFFVTCLKRIKSEFPDVKVGGPALCTWRDDKEPVMADGAPSAWTRKYRNTSAYFRAILSACKEAGVAPDFISWHYYGKNPDDVMAAISKARRLCDEMGFPNCELIINEWHYRARSWGELGSPDPKVRRSVWTGPASHNGIDSSCFNLTLLSRFQTSALDQSFYYGCKNIGNWGYKDTFGEKYKVYYGLKMFGDFLRDYPVICSSSSDKKGVTVIAAKSADSKRKAALVTDYCSKSASLTVKFNDVAPDAKCKILVHDYERDLETVDAKLVNGSLTLPKKDTNSAAFVVMF